jgi:hypothetical protein
LFESVLYRDTLGAIQIPVTTKVIMMVTQANAAVVWLN